MTELHVGDLIMHPSHWIIEIIDISEQMCTFTFVWSKYSAEVGNVRTLNAKHITDVPAYRKIYTRTCL